MPMIPTWLWRIILVNLGLELPDVAREAIKKIPDRDEGPGAGAPGALSPWESESDPYLAECAYDRACAAADRHDIHLHTYEENDDADDHWE